LEGNCGGLIETLSQNLSGGTEGYSGEPQSIDWCPGCDYYHSPPEYTLRALLLDLFAISKCFEAKFYESIDIRIFLTYITGAAESV
jgi:hypothetical protein